MPSQLNKWYLDFQNDTEFGYYYVATLRFGPLNLCFSEVRHLWNDSSLHWSSVGLTERETLRSLSGNNTEMQCTKNRIQYRFSKNDKSLSGTWHLDSPSPLRLARPLYENRRGWCDWSIWSSRSPVALDISGDQRRRVRGNGYVDYVRLTFPLWTIPLNSLFWGRLFSDVDSIIFFRMDVPEETKSWIIHPDCIYDSVDLRMNDSGSDRSKTFAWRYDGSVLECRSTRTIHRGPILSQDRLSRWIPKHTLNWMSSEGFEAKYFVRADVEGKTYRGPMEEVYWS